MSQIENAVTSSSKEKRSYRKGKPMSASERQLAAIARKRETHKEVKVFVKNPLKECPPLQRTHVRAGSATA